MSEPWTSIDKPVFMPHGVTDYWRIVRRALPLILLIAVCLILLMVVRLIERPIAGQNRPVTPYITQFVCRNAFRLMGMGYTIEGKVMGGAGAIVANHASWLDIFALNAAKRIYFVSKAEVARWPGIGLLARATGTVFIRRDRKQAASQVKVFQDRLALGHRLLFFPEGTSTDGLQVLPFKPTLFAAFFAPELRDSLSIQPVTVVYSAPAGADPRHYGWWGDMDLGPHLLSTLAMRHQGSVRVIYHPPVKVAAFQDRKSLAKATENIVRAGLATHQIAQ